MPRTGRKTLDAATASGSTIIVSGTTSGTTNTITTVAHGQDLTGLTAGQRTAWAKHSLRAVATGVTALLGGQFVAIVDCDATNLSVSAVAINVPYDVVAN